MNSGLPGLLQPRLRYLQFQGTNKRTTMIGDTSWIPAAWTSSSQTSLPPVCCKKMDHQELVQRCSKWCYSGLAFTFWPGSRFCPGVSASESDLVCVSKKRPQKESRRLKISGANKASTLAKHIMVKKSRWGSMRIHNTTKDRTEQSHPKNQKSPVNAHPRNIPLPMVQKKPIKSQVISSWKALWRKNIYLQQDLNLPLQNVRP